MDDDYDGYDGDRAEGCGPCARGGGLLLLGVGLVLGFMGADLLTGGMLTGPLSGAARARAGAYPADNEAEGASGAGEAGDTADDDEPGE